MKKRLRRKKTTSSKGRYIGGVALQISNLARHPLRYVYASSIIQFLSQILLLFILIKTTNHSDFADYSYAALVPGIAAVITNACFDSLLNKELGRTCGASGFYNLAGEIKPILYLLISVPAWIFFAPRNPFWLFILISLANIFIEHGDVLFRFHSEYKLFRTRAIICAIFIIPKISLAINAQLHYLILCILIEQISIISINHALKRRIGIFTNPSDFGNVSTRDLIKSFIGGTCIFVFFKIDQLLLYQISEKQLFAYYSAASRINDMHNSLVSIFARHITPKIYSNQLSYKSGLIKLWIFNTTGIVFTILGSACIFLIAAPEYLKTMVVLIPLLISSYFLIFGQIRGIYFVKRDKLFADTINALIGIGIIFCFVRWTEFPLDLRFSLSYLLAFAITGMITTVIYTTGREFLKEIGHIHHGR